jgi:hypothetical protein
LVAAERPQFIESKVGVTARLVDDLPSGDRRLVADITILPGVKRRIRQPEKRLERLTEAYRAGLTLTWRRLDHP